MKPVELEIFLQDGLSPGLKSAGAVVSRFSDDAKAELKEVTESLKLQKQHVARLSQELKALEKAYKSATPGAEKKAMGARLNELRKELEDEKGAITQLTEMQDNLRRKQEEGGASLRMQLRTLREEIATLLLAYRSLTDAEKNTAQGRALAQHIDELTEKAGELNDAIGDTSQAVTNAASDTRGFDQLAGAMQLVVDGFGLATAGAQAFGLSEEDLLEVQTQLQTALVASNALTSMQTNLQKQSALMQGVVAIQTKAAATAENIKTWAVGRGVVATKAATIAQAAFNAVAKANPYVLLAMAVVTVVGALYAFAKGSKEAQKAEEERQAQAEKMKQQQEEYAQAVVNAAGEQIASFLKLKREWENLGDSFDKKKKFITDTKEEWRKLGKEIDNVNDMEEIFRSHTKDMLTAIILRAELKAYETRIQQAADDMVSEIEKNKTFTYSTVSAGKAISGWYAGYGPASGGTWTAPDITPEEMAAVEGHTYYKSGFGGGNTMIDAEGARIINEMRHDAGNQAALDRQEAARQRANQTIAGYVDTMTSLSNQLEASLNNVPGKTVDPDAKATPTPRSTTSHSDNRVEMEERVAEALRKLRLKNQQEEIDQLADGGEKRRRQIALDYEKEKGEIERMKQSFAASNAEMSIEGLDAEGLTAEQSAAINEANELNERKRQRAIAETYQDEFRFMQEQLKEYGTYQQQRLAITTEYAEKIKNAQSESERQSLTRERDSLLAGVKSQELKSGIDWSIVFGEFGSMFSGVVEPMLAKAKAYIETDEFKNSDHASQEAVIDAIRQMEQSVGGVNKVSFGKLGTEINALQQSMERLDAAQTEYAQAYDQLQTAQARYIEAQSTGTEAEREAAASALETAQANEAAAAENVATLQNATDALQRDVTNTATTLKSAMDGVVSGLQKLASGSLSGAYTGLIEFGKGAEKIGGKVGEAFGKVAAALEDVPIIGWIVSIIDVFKDGLSVVIEGLLDAVFNAVSGILSDILSGDLFVTIFESITSGIGNIFDAITFGGFSSWFSSSNAKEVQETIDRLTERNATLQTAIEDLTDEIKASKGTKSVAAYRDAYKYQQETNANYLEMASAQAGYHGSHHSWNYYFDGFTQEQIDRLSRQIGRQWDGSLWSLSPEEMKLLRSNVDMWESIRNTGKGNYGGRLTEKLDDYIAQAGKLEELTTQLYEGLTGISFDSLYDSFIDQLMDMEASTEDFADNISEYFMRAMLSNKIGELYADKLEEWWKKFGKAMEDNDLTEEERKALADEYMKYVEEAMKIRDGLAAATGYDSDSGSSQSGKAGGFNAMSQDQGTKLEGLFVSVQGHVANIDNVCENVIGKMNSAEGYLAKIADSTGASAEFLEKIKEYIEAIKRDGIKTR